MSEAPWAWSIEVLDTRSASLAENHIAVGDDARVEITYYMMDSGSGYNSPWLARRVGDAWLVELLGVQGFPLGVYLDGAESHYAYGRGNGVGGRDVIWEMRSEAGIVQEIVANTAPDLVSSGSLFVDSVGTPHLLAHFPGSGASLRHFWRAQPGQWQSEVVRPSGAEPAFAMDRFDRIHLVAWTSNLNNNPVTCTYMVRDPATATWSSETLTGCGNGLSIATDSEGYPHVAGRTLQDGFFYMRKTATGWDREVLFPPQRLVSGGPQWMACETSIAIDSLDRPHIAYHNCNNPSAEFDFQRSAHLSYAFKGERVPGTPGPFADGSIPEALTNGWIFQTIDPTGNSQGYPAIALDAQDRPYIAYTYFGIGPIALMREPFPSWDLRYATPANEAVEAAAAGGS